MPHCPLAVVPQRASRTSTVTCRATLPPPPCASTVTPTAYLPAAVPSGMEIVRGRSALAGRPSECSTPGDATEAVQPSGACVVAFTSRLPSHCPTTLTVVDTERCAVDTTTVPGLTAALSDTRASSACASTDGASSPGWVPQALGVAPTV